MVHSRMYLPGNHEGLAYRCWSCIHVEPIAQTSLAVLGTRTMSTCSRCYVCQVSWCAVSMTVGCSRTPTIAWAASVTCQHEFMLMYGHVI